MKRGRPNIGMETKMHSSIRRRIEYKGRGTYVSDTVRLDARRNRPRDEAGKKVSAAEASAA